jgi:hypothetical protein
MFHYCCTHLLTVFFSSLSYIPLFARSLKHKNAKCTRNYLLLIQNFYLFTATGFGERSNSKGGSLPGRATFWRIHRIISRTSMFPQEISQKGNTIQCVSTIYALMVRTHVQYYKNRSNYWLDLGGRVPKYVQNLIISPIIFLSNEIHDSTGGRDGPEYYQVPWQAWRYLHSMIQVGDVPFLYIF